MNYKMIAMDLDDTLTTSEKVISPKTYARLMEAQEKGMIIVLASGRTVIGMSKLADELKLDKYGGYVLAFNGARIINWRTKEEVYTLPVPSGSLSAIFDLCEEHKMPLLTHENDHLVVEEPENPYIIAEAKINQMPIQKIDSFRSYIDFPVYKFIAVGDGDYLATKEPILREALAPACDVYRSTPYFMEIVASGIDKGEGLKRLAGICNIPMSEVVACGDGYNDIGMIRAAGLGVAMKNALPDVRAAADYITASNDEDGIALLFDEKISLT
ncbi:MAG: Cof-type HAD-IIB family hydrolase [Lachnospiraceae bacterium]|nr:Cof-type HAD-IIB family hydrolase [Lachnospiraceae bacterium]